MNTKKYLKYSFLPLVLMLGGLAFTACTDDIEGGKPVDEGAYDAVKRVDGMLLDVTSNKNESVIELRARTNTRPRSSSALRKRPRRVST